MFKKRPQVARSVAITISTESPPKKKRSVLAKELSPRNATSSMSPENDSLLLDSEINYVRNQMSLLQSISYDDPVYDVTFQNVIAHLKSRPPFRTIVMDDDGLRIVWEAALTQDIHYRYEMIEMGNEVMLRCMFWAMGRFVETMNLRISSHQHPILHVHNIGYIPLSLIGSQFSHHFYAFEYFVRILYSLASILKRRKLLTTSRQVLLQTLPKNPLDLRVQVMVNVPSADFATEIENVDVGTLQDMLFARPKHPMLKAGKRKKKCQK